MTFLRLCLICISCSIAVSTSSAKELNHVWSDSFGAPAAGDTTYGQSGVAVAIDGWGDILITTELRGTVDFGGGPLASAGSPDILVAKFEANGAHVWSKRFGDSDYQKSEAIATDGAGSVIVGGYFQGTVDFGGGPLTSAGGTDIFVAKFSFSGTHLWSKRFGLVAGQDLTGLAVDGSHSVIITGTFLNGVDFGGGLLWTAGQGDIFLAKFDAAGNHVWSYSFGDAGHQYGVDVGVDGSDNVVMVGDNFATVDFGGGPLTSAGSTDIFCAKFNASGTHLWSSQFGDASQQNVEAIALDSADNAILCGSFRGGVSFGGGALASAGDADIFLAKLNSGGAHVWSYGFGDTEGQYGSDVTIDGFGNVILGANFHGTVDFGGGLLTSVGNRDAALVKFNSVGAHLWSDHFGTGGLNDTRGVAADNSVNVAILGDFSTSIDLGGGPLNALGGIHDMFMAKFTPVPDSIVVSPESATTTEGGGTDTFAVVLESRPSADVTIDLSSSDTGEGTVSPAQVVLGRSNWSTPQIVTATGVDDDVDDGAQAYSIITAAATSSDEDYDGFNASDVSATNTDDDTAGITVFPTSGLVTTEEGGSDTFSLELDSEPTADVTISLTSSDLTEGTVLPSLVTFNSLNWSSAKTVTVSGVDDPFADGVIAYAIMTEPATSLDGKYDGMNPPNVSVSNTDDDVAIPTVSEWGMVVLLLTLIVVAAFYMRRRSYRRFSSSR